MPDIKFSNKYPYTDFHELNLDWIIKEVKFWSERVGKSIQKIEKTGTVGLVDTYTITYSDGTTSTFDVTNGNGIASVAKTGTVGLVDTYTITFQDGSTTTFEVTNGTAAIDPTLTLSDYAADAKATGDAIHRRDINPFLFSIIRNGQPYGNMWDGSNYAFGYFQNVTGELIEGGTTFVYSPTYIPVTPGDVLVYNNTRPMICIYNDVGDVLACSQGAWAGYTVPAGAKYARFSLAAASVSGMYIFVNGTPSLHYTNDTQLYLPKLKTTKPIIYVTKTGAGDYTSLTEALYDTYDESPDVIVSAGDYDLVDEYKTLFGNTIFDTMTYLTPGMKGFQWGLYIENRTVTFESGARILCDMSAYTNDGSRRFSPINMVRNAVIDGCYCYAVNPYYIIHDDFGENTDPAFTNVIKNCILISPEPAQGNVIGGGVKKLSTKIVDNCYLDNGLNRPVTMRYHNTDVVGAVATVIIKNTRANGIIRVNSYGTQTSTKMTAIVNNCEAKQIEKSFEGGSTIDNVDLYEWCNIVE